MIRRSPAEYYIKYLLVHPDNFSDERIEETLAEYHLDNPGGSYLPRLRRQVDRPRPFFPYDELHFNSYRFLTRQKIVHMFFPDKATMGALKILETPRAKEIVETMLITEDPDLLICHRLESIGVRIDPPAIQRYRHFFFNVVLVDRAELRALMEVRFKATPFDGEGVYNSARALALKHSGYSDPRWIAANAPNARVASMMNSIREGFLPTSVNLAKLAHSTAVLAMTRMQAEMLATGPESSGRSRDYSIVAQNVYALLEQIGAPDEELRNELISMGVELQHSEKKVPSLQQLTDGNFSADLQLVKNDEEVDSND